MKSLFVLSIGGVLASILIGSPVQAATQQHFYDIGLISNPGWYDGYWNQLTLSTTSPAWISGNQNKINQESWFNTDGSTGDWIEFGYHTGYGYDQYGEEDDYNFYSGAFSASKSQDGFSWELNTWPSLAWVAGQNHTIGFLINPQGGYDIRADGKVITNYSDGYQPTSGNIETGYEWGNSSGALQSAGSLTLYNQNVHNSSGWHLLNTMSGISAHDDPTLGTHTAKKTTWLPATNQFTIQ